MNKILCVGLLILLGSVALPGTALPCPSTGSSCCDGYLRPDETIAMLPEVSALVDTLRDKYQRGLVSKDDLCTLLMRSVALKEEGLNTLQALVFLLHEQHVVCDPTGKPLSDKAM